MGSAAAFSLCFLASVVWLFLPASILARYVARLHPEFDRHLDSLTLLSAATIGYIAFWVYVLGLGYGMTTSIVAVATACAYFHGRWRVQKEQLFSAPLLWLIAVGILYSGLLCLNGPRVVGPDLPRALYSFELRSIDNLIPLWFAKAVVDPSLPRVGFTFGDWMYSDRPPLQTGVVLFAWPLTYLFRVEVVYQAVSMVAQLFWVAAAVTLLKAFRASRRRVGYVLLLLASSGFIYFNSVYTWPKLFAAAFCLIAVSSLSEVWLQKQRLTVARLLLYSWAVAFAALAHPGAVVGCLAVGLVVLVARRGCVLLPPRILLVAAGAFLVLYLPWTAYVRFVDPPGTRLLIWHLAGRSELVTGSVAKEVWLAYKQLGSKQWVERRLSHFYSMFADPVLDADIAACYKMMRGASSGGKLSLPPERQRYYLQIAEIPATVSSLATLLRYDQVEQVFRSLGLLNVAWLIGPILWWRRRENWAPDLTGLVLPAAGIGLLIFNLTLFGRGAFVNRNLCHGTLLYLFIGAAWILYASGPLARRLMMAVHLAFNSALWVYFVPNPMAAGRLGLEGRSLWAMGEVLVGIAGIVLLCFGVPFRLRRAFEKEEVSSPEKSDEPWVWRGQHTRVLAGILAPLYVAAGAVIIRDGGGGVIVQMTNVANGACLFDGVRDDPENYAMIPFGSPAIVHFGKPLLLEEIRLRLFDRDGRYYRLTVEYESFGRWIMALDSSEEDRSGMVVIPLPAKPITGIRINGLYNSRQEFEPWNKILHIHELELVRRVETWPVRFTGSR